jgi:hypothetical protein
VDVSANSWTIVIFVSKTMEDAADDSDLDRVLMIEVAAEI